MDEIGGLQERLDETERRANEVVQQLEHFESLQQSLANAGRGLGEANANIVSLAAATRAAIESWHSTLSAFREAVEVLRSSDPAQVRETLTGIEAELGRITAKLSVVDKLGLEIQSTRKAVEEGMERLLERSLIDRIFGRTRKT